MATCICGHSDVALRLLDLPDITWDYCNHKYPTAFIVACANNMTEVVEKMLRMSVDYNCITNQFKCKRLDKFQMVVQD